MDSFRCFTLWVYIFCHIWEVFSHYFFKCFFSLALFVFPFQNSDDTNVRSLVIVLQVAETLFIFFCCSDWIISYCSVFWFTYSFLCPFILLLSPSTEFFILIIVCFSSKIPICFSSHSSISLLRLYMYLPKGFLFYSWISYLLKYFLNVYLTAPGLSHGMQDLRSCCGIWVVYLRHVGSLSCGMRTPTCGMWDLVPQPGIEPRHLTLEVGV